MGRWRPVRGPADRANPPPPLPYCSGLTLQIRRHIPPPPFGHPGYARPHRRQEVLPERDEVLPSRVQYLLHNPPPPGRPHPDDSVHSLEIVDQIAAQDGRGPQVVLCRLDGQKELIAAKIFDPLYYPIMVIPICVDCDADIHYSCEAAGYEKVQQAGIDGKYLPKYHGSWTFDMPLAGQQRQVRMVLMEHIPGRSLLSLIKSGEYQKYNLETRLEVLAQAMEKYAMLVYHGVKQRDLEPRNVILGDDMRVTIIDLGISSVDGLPNSRVERAYPKHRGPPSPLDFGSCDMRAWVPEKRPVGDCSTNPLDEWLRRRWEGCDGFAPSVRLERERIIAECREREEEEAEEAEAAAAAVQSDE